jgi:DeoR/GlpR family transcriptional regulator of sugar metabolism
MARKRSEGGHLLAETRRRGIEEHLKSAGSMSVAEVEERFGVSPMTARRDLAELARRGVLRRTHGGAVLPSISAEEDSFSRRLEIAAPEKRQLAEAVVSMLPEQSSVFLDSSTTSYYVARRIAETQLAATVLTNSLPILNLLFNEGGPSVEAIAMGGTLRRVNRSFVGPYTVQTINGHFADRLFFSVKAVAENGVLTEADPLEAEVKRAMIAQAGESTLLIDRSKLSARGLTAIAPIADITLVQAVGLSTLELAALNGLGARVQNLVPEPADN